MDGIEPQRNPLENVDASHLAYMVTNPVLGRQQQLDAWNILLERHITPIAITIKARFGHTISNEFVDEAGSIIWELLNREPRLYDWRIAPFDHWCSSVLQHRAIDQWRRYRRHRERTESVDPDDVKIVEPPLPLPPGELLERLDRLCLRLRAEFDRLSGAKALNAKVNYFAVLLMEFRRSVVTRLARRRLLPGLGDSYPRWQNLRDADAVAQLLPWQPAERQLRIREGFPRLGDLWSTLSKYVNGEPHDLPAHIICQHIHPAGQKPITIDRWFNWTRHLRNRLTRKTRKAGPLVDHKTWKELFEPWCAQDAPDEEPEADV